MTLPAYAELHCLSNFTFLRGASRPEELVERSIALGYDALAITDECSVAGVVRAHSAIKDHHARWQESQGKPLRLIIGSEIHACDITLVLLATDRASYGELSQLISRGRRAAVKGEYRLERGDIAALSAGCLALWLPQRSLRAPTPTPTPTPTPARAPSAPEPATLSPALIPSSANLEEQVGWMREVFGERAWIAAELMRDGQDRRWLERLTQLAQYGGLRLVASGDVHMHVRERRALQDAVTAIRLGVPLSQAGRALHPNGERHLRDRARLAKLYPSALLDETLAVAERCRFSLSELRYEYPHELVPEGHSPTSYLRHLTEEGVRERWPRGAPPETAALIEHELALIEDLKYEPFFLTVRDIVAHARSLGILCQGRGSAANSAVCFCLRVTEVDPVGAKLVVERFISKERNEPPDIDVDFEHDRREEVIQYIYSKYGRRRAALAATVITYRSRSALRDLGKALGLDPVQTERLAGAMQWWDGNAVLAERIAEAGFDPGSPIIARLLALTRELIGFPRHLSQHVGGFVISEGLLEALVPIENAAMPDRTVIQWDKDDLEDLGLLKVDVLALGMLSAIRRALALISKRRPDRPPLRMEDIPAGDPDVYDMICRADTVGVFQIESRAQMSMLPRLRPRKFYDLVIQVAIVRPGPIQGDMVHPYLRRRTGAEEITYPSPEVEKVLERTLGVPLFQEQVMQLAVEAAGFTPGEADQLRRAMAAWNRRGGIDHFERRLIEGMRERGYSDEFARQIFNQILGFGEYGFPESHAASFAHLVYVSAWIKHHEPAAFACALLNSQPMGFYAPAQLLRDARNHGVEVRAADVNASDHDATLEELSGADSGASVYAGAGVPQPALRIGLRSIKGLSKEAADRIAAARRVSSFVSVQDLAIRGELDRGDLEALAASGALANLTGHRHLAFWEVAGSEKPLPAAPVATGEALPMLAVPTEGENIVADYRSLGFTLGRHPVALLRERLRRHRVLATSDLSAEDSGRDVCIAGIVITRQRPGGGNVTFVTLEDETGHVNVIVWERVANAQRRALLESRLLEVHGRLQREGEVTHVIARRLIDRSRLLGELVPRSRDFH